jgi:hypothetical protein
MKGGTKEREKQSVNCIDNESASEDEAKVCVFKWVDTPADIMLFLEAKCGKKGRVKFTFDVSKCDKLFDVLVQGGVIQLAEGHVIPSPEVLARKKYCKWHDSYSHTTNECNYFRRQVQSALNDGQLTLSEGGKMKLDVDPFPVNMLELGQKKILVRTDQASTTKGKNVIISDDLKNRMLKPKSPKAGV